MIVGVAVRVSGVIWKLPRPARHHHLRSILPGGYLPSYDGEGRPCQGFYTDAGEYLGREEAFKHAMACGQVDRPAGGHDGPELFSEDLW